MKRYMPHPLLITTLVIALSIGTGGPTAAEQPDYGDVIGPVTPTSMGVKMPATSEEAARLTPAQQQRIERAVYARLPQWVALLEAGK